MVHRAFLVLLFGIASVVVCEQHIDLSRAPPSFERVTHGGGHLRLERDAADLISSLNVDFDTQDALEFMGTAFDRLQALTELAAEQVMSGRRIAQNLTPEQRQRVAEDLAQEEAAMADAEPGLGYVRQAQRTEADEPGYDAVEQSYAEFNLLLHADVTYARQPGELYGGLKRVTDELVNDAIARMQLRDTRKPEAWALRTENIVIPQGGMQVVRSSEYWEHAGYQRVRNEDSSRQRASKIGSNRMQLLDIYFVYFTRVTHRHGAHYEDEWSIVAIERMPTIEQPVSVLTPSRSAPSRSAAEGGLAAGERGWEQ